MEELVIYWKSKAAMDQSARNQENRAKKKMNHVSGKKSVDQIIEEMKEEMQKNSSAGEADDATTDDEPSRVDLYERVYTHHGRTSNQDVADDLRKMKELKSALPPGVKDKGPNDIYSQVAGPDKWGRVRLGGYGATAVQVYEGRPSKGACYRANTAYQQEIGKLSQRVDEQDKMIQEQHRQIQELMKLNKQIIGTMDPRPNPQMPSSSHFPTISRKHSTSSNAKKPLKVGDKVELKNAEESKNVAVGFIESLDPNKKVSGVDLAKQWCEVRVIIGVDMDEELPRSFLDFTTIGEVIGKCIAWPLYLVQIADDD